MNYVIMFVVCGLFFYGMILFKAWCGGEHITKKDAVHGAGQFLFIVGAFIGGAFIIAYAIAFLFGK
jgi:hypothetical protein